MSQNKKQHYVPQCLLKNFTATNNKFYVFQIRKNEISPNQIGYKTQCQSDYLYGKDLSIEHNLAHIEFNTAPIFRKIILSETLSFEEESILKQFILVQYLRTMRQVDIQKSSFVNVYKKLLPVVAQSEGISLTPAQTAICIKNLLNTMDYKSMVLQNVEFAQDNLSHLDDLKLIILKSSNIDFVCSDHPVIIMNKYQEYLGIDCAGIIFIMPISPQNIAVLYDDGIYNFDYYISNHMLIDTETQAINNMLFLRARELLYSKSIESLQKIKVYFDKQCIDDVLRENFITLGIKDPILINRKISEFKESNVQLIKSIIPHHYAKNDISAFKNCKIKEQFGPFVNNLNANFSRFTNIDDIPDKYYMIGEDYVQIIRQYLENRR